MQNYDVVWSVNKLGHIVDRESFYSITSIFSVVIQTSRLRQDWISVMYYQVECQLIANKTDHILIQVWGGVDPDIW